MKTLPCHFDVRRSLFNSCQIGLSGRCFIFFHVFGTAGLVHLGGRGLCPYVITHSVNANCKNQKPDNLLKSL
jgi:hypothetical protein